ncbi:MAG: heme-binding protein [Planctomycetota bacterium]
MTAPVEMGHSMGRTVCSPLDMAFLYRRPEHPAGAEPDVKVEQRGPRTALVLGCRGTMDQASVQRAAEILRTALHRLPGYQPTERVLVLGYNSPMVPWNQRFYEVAIELEPLSN